MYVQLKEKGLYKLLPFCFKECTISHKYLIAFYSVILFAFLSSSSFWKVSNDLKGDVFSYSRMYTEI